MQSYLCVNLLSLSFHLQAIHILHKVRTCVVGINVTRIVYQKVGVDKIVHS